jgi:hypothetical protein
MATVHKSAFNGHNKDAVATMTTVTDCLIDYYMEAIEPDLVNALSDDNLCTLRCQLRDKLIEVLDIITTE